VTPVEDPAEHAAQALRAIVARPLPQLYLAQVRWTERLALRALRARMDAVAQDGADEASDAAPRACTPRERFVGLLAQSVALGADDAVAALHLRILDGMLPDEARMVAALGRQGIAATVDVCVRGTRRSSDGAILERASSLGRMSGVAVPALTPVYLARLGGLGVVRFGGEDPRLEAQYDLLAASRWSAPRWRPGRRTAAWAHGWSRAAWA
jgi:hypothetical protein